MPVTTPYKTAVRNAAAHILNHPAGTPECIDAFTLSTSVAVSFGYDEMAVIEDIIAAQKNLKALSNNDPDWDGVY